jgi:hypothetical protein
MPLKLNTFSSFVIVPCMGPMAVITTVPGFSDETVWQQDKMIAIVVKKINFARRIHSP